MRHLAVVSADKEILELVGEDGDVRLLGFFDSNPAAAALGYPHLGDDSQWAGLKARYADLQAVLSLDQPAVKLAALRTYGLESLATVVSRGARVSPHADVGRGCILQHGVSVLSDARVGVACKINVNATIHHDSTVGDYSTVAPGAQILGAVRIGERSFIGAGAVILPKVTVGANVIVGAGAVVTRDVPDGTVVAGNPARKLRDLL